MIRLLFIVPTAIHIYATAKIEINGAHSIHFSDKITNTSGRANTANSIMIGKIMKQVIFKILEKLKLTNLYRSDVHTELDIKHYL